MRTRGRRRLDAAVLAGCGLLVGAAGMVGAAAGDGERVNRMWIVAEVTGADGGAQVTEVIDYDFGGIAIGKHGIYRTVPQLDPWSPITVSSDTAPDEAEVTSDSGDARIRIGDPGQTVSGRHRYEIEYPLPGMVELKHVVWDAIGTAWTVPVEQAEIHLLMPSVLHEVKCYIGRVGSTERCDVRDVAPGHVAVTVDDLPSGRGITLEANTGALIPPPDRPAPPPDLPAEPGTGPLPPGLAAGGAALVAVLPATLLVRRAGRERVAVGGPSDAAFAGAGRGPGPGPGPGPGEVQVDATDLAAMATTEFAPPPDLTPSQGGIVLTEAVSPEHKVAWLIEAAIAGDVDLVEEGGRPVRLRRTGQSPERAGILDVAFHGRPDVQLGTYDESFGQAWGALTGELERWRNSSGLWDRAADQRRALALGFGLLGAVVGLLAVVVGGWVANTRGGSFGLLLGGLGGAAAGAGLAAAIGGWELRVRTPAGSAAWLRVESFRRFLAASEGFHAEEAAKRGVLREYTAWAVAVGEVDRWSRAVQAASTAIPPSTGLAYASMAPALLASTSSTATAPSSSGGGGSGGSVGSGVGGGGGGSW